MHNTTLPPSGETLENLVSAAEAVTGKRLHLSTPLRWAQKGWLETWMIGGRRQTTQGAVRRMIERRTSATAKKPVDIETPAQADRRANAAAKKLAERISSK